MGSGGGFRPRSRSIVGEQGAEGGRGWKAEGRNNLSPARITSRACGRSTLSTSIRGKAPCFFGPPVPKSRTVARSSWQNLGGHVPPWPETQASPSVEVWSAKAIRLRSRRGTLATRSPSVATWVLKSFSSRNGCLPVDPSRHHAMVLDLRTRGKAILGLGKRGGGCELCGSPYPRTPPYQSYFVHWRSLHATISPSRRYLWDCAVLQAPNAAFRSRKPESFS